jgi:CrcB protein
MTTVIWVALGGAIGASARYLVGVQAVRIMGHGFPWGTLVVNVAGSLIMGILVSLMAIKFSSTQDTRAFLTVGILGGFTTFSAFSLDVVVLFERKEMMLMAVYLAASVVLSIAALFVGLWGARSLLS